MALSVVGKVRSKILTFQRRKLWFRDKVRVNQLASGGARTGPVHHWGPELPA